MAQYSIKDLESLSGVKSHTIRIWEQRYRLLKPGRTDTNIRYYSDNDLRKLMNVSLLNDSGLRISQISKLTENEINTRLESLNSGDKGENLQINSFISQMIVSGLNFDEAVFEKAFSASLLRFGLKDTYTKTIYPLLVKMGLMWSRNEILPVQEHFISNLIKQKLFAAIDSVPPPSIGSKTWLLFLPEHEEHELGLLFANYIIRSSGHKVVYMGQRVPIENLKKSDELCNPDFIYTFFVKNISEKQMDKTTEEMTNTFGNKKIYVSGNEKILRLIKSKNKFSTISDIGQLTDLLK